MTAASFVGQYELPAGSRFYVKQNLFNLECKADLDTCYYIISGTTSFGRAAVPATAES